MKKLLLIGTLLTLSVFAEFNVGDTFPKTVLDDQFKKSMEVENSDKLVIMAFEKDTSIGISTFLKAQSKDFMAKKQMKYISDISSMPSFVTSMFALPKMKKYPFSVMLIEDEFGKQFNRKDAKVTLYKLKNRKIIAIEFIDPKNLNVLTTK
jgi:hypothetical protein